MFKTRAVVVALLLTCVTIPIVALGGFYSATIKKDMFVHAVERNEVLVKTFSELIGAYMQQPLLSFNQVLLENYTRERGHSHEGLLNAIVDQTLFFQSIFMVDGKGIVLDAGLPEHLRSLRTELLALDFRGHDLFKEDMPVNKPVWSNVTTSIVTGNPVVSVAFGDGNVVLIGDLTLEQIKPIFSNFTKTAQQEIMLVDGRGVVIQGTDPRKGEEAMSVSNYDIVKLGMTGQSGTLQYLVGNTLKIGTVAPVLDTGWMIVVQQNYHEAIGLHDHIRMNFILIALFFLSATLVAGIWISRRIEGFVLALSKLLVPLADKNAVPVAPAFLTAECHDFWCNLREVIDNFQGRVKSLVDYNSDILETQEELGQLSQKLSHQDRALRIKTEALDQLMASLTSGVISLDEKSDITFCNRAALDMLGYSNEHQLKGRNIRALLPSFSEHRTKERHYHDCPLPCTSVNEGGACIKVSQGLKSIFLGADDSEVFVCFSATPLIKGDERIGCVLSFHRVEDEI